MVYEPQVMTDKTGTYICKQMGYDSLVKLGLVHDNPYYWFANLIPSSSEYGMQCDTGKGKCVNSAIKPCAAPQYYVTISCGCPEEKYYTKAGCSQCPRRTVLDQETGICKCQPRAVQVS